jgi:hypothetical protein
MRAQGWLPGRDVIVLSDGDLSLVDTVRRATHTSVDHILDWFHASMRLHHLTESCRSLVEADRTGEIGAYASAVVLPSRECDRS